MDDNDSHNPSPPPAAHQQVFKVDLLHDALVRGFEALSDLFWFCWWEEEMGVAVNKTFFHPFHLFDRILCNDILEF